MSDLRLLLWSYSNQEGPRAGKHHTQQSGPQMSEGRSIRVGSHKRCNHTRTTAAIGARYGEVDCLQKAGCAAVAAWQRPT